MNKKIVLSILAATSLLYGYNDGYDSDDSSEESTLVKNQTVVNNIIADATKTDLAENDKHAGMGGTTKRFAATAQYIYSDKINIFNIPLGMNVGYGFGVEVNVPVVLVDKEASPTGENESGLGDISAGINYHYGFMAAPSGLSIFTVLYKTTTGDEKKGLGSGADAYSFSYKYAKSFGKYALHALGNYTINNTYDGTGWSVDYGDSYMAMIGGSMPCLLSDKVTTSAKLNYFHGDENENSWGTEFGKVDTVDLWVQWDTTELIKNVPLGAGVKIPLMNEVDDKDVDKKFSFYVSISGLF